MPWRGRCRAVLRPGVADTCLADRAAQIGKSRAGAVLSKSATLEPRDGNPLPRCACAHACHALLLPLAGATLQHVYHALLLPLPGAAWRASAAPVFVVWARQRCAEAEPKPGRLRP